MGDVSVTFRHLEATAALREYAVEKASKIRNYLAIRMKSPLFSPRKSIDTQQKSHSKLVELPLMLRKKQRICILLLM